MKNQESAAAGIVEQIHIAPTGGAPVAEVTEAVVRVGAGIDGDRYGRGIGTFSHYPKDHELTLIEAEVLENMANAHNIVSSRPAKRGAISRRGVLP